MQVCLAPCRSHPFPSHPYPHPHPRLERSDMWPMAGKRDTGCQDSCFGKDTWVNLRAVQRTLDRSFEIPQPDMSQKPASVRAT